MLYQFPCTQKFGLPEIEDFAFTGANKLTQCGSKYLFAKVCSAGFPYFHW